MQPKRPATWYFFSLIAALGLFFACSKERSVDTGSGFQNAPVNVTTSIQGRITDENQEPVKGALVYSGAHSTTTDLNGNFLLEDMISEANATTVHVEKDGYFNGSRTITAGEDQLQYVQIELLPKKISGSFTNASGGSVQLPNCTIQFAANQVLKENNAVYTGTVQVAYAYLNPESSNFSRIMPGDLRGIDTEGKEVGLQSFGMIGVELQGASGEKLHLDSTKTATLNFTIPASLQGSSPISIPLWYFQEETGLWKEEGSAVKQGSLYIGKVKHFSFWNCDAPFSVVDFKAKFQDLQGAALSNLLVEITVKASGAKLSAYLNSDGSVAGKIPANANLQMRVLQSFCQTEVYRMDLGPYTQAADLGTLKIAMTAQQQLAISGNVTNCSGTAVTNGFVTVGIDGIKYRTAITAGKYAITIARCNATSTTEEITAFDETTSKYNTGTLTVNNGAVTFDIQACTNTASQYINMSINNQSVQYAMPADSISTSVANYLTVYAFKRSGASENMSFSFLNTGSTGATSLGSFYYTSPANKFYYNTPSDNISVNITKTDGISIEGTVAGNITDSSQTPVAKLPLSITFKILNR